MPKHRFIAGFDTEDDGKGTPYLFAVVHEKGSWIGHTRVEALEYILTLARDLKQSDTVLELWATNLEYDLVNLFGVERIREVALRFGKSNLVGASWRGHNVDFRDTVRHIPLGVKELGKLVGMPKLVRKKGVKGNEAYCVRDAAITRRFAVWLNDKLYAPFNIPPKQTLASSALAIWKTNYWQREIELPAEEIYTNAKLAYYGGRTEAFAIGSWKDVRVLDVASMFPWAMLADKFPIPWGQFRRYVKGDEISEYGIYRAKITGRLLNPFLPVRTKNGTAYPNGIFHEWYAGCEILYGIERGYRVEVTEGYEFLEYAIPFIGYVSAFFELKKGAKGAARLGYKTLMNGLYGKYGQGGERIVAVPIERFVRMRYPPTQYRVWNGICIYSVKGKPPPWGNNVWPALITARARIKLAREMERIREHGGIVLYCDTDSIIYSGAKELRYPKKSEHPGNFELRGEYKEILIAGKKEYGLRDSNRKWEIHVKGVPSIVRENYLHNGLAEYQQPIRLREAARRGLQPNVWVDKRKQRKVNYDNRERHRDGTLKPLTVDTATVF